MPAAVVAKTSKSSSDAVSVTTDPIDTTGANAIILAYAVGGGTGATPTDSKGNTYTGLTAYQSGNVIKLWHCQNPIVGSGHTFSLSTGGGSFPCLAAIALSGMSTSALYDGEENGNTTGTGPSGSITPSVNRCLVVTACAMSSTTDSFVVDGSFVVQEHKPLVSGLAYGLGIAMFEQNPAAAIEATWTVASLGPVTIASFRTVPGGGKGAGGGGKGNKGGGGVSVQQPGGASFVAFNPGVDIGYGS